MKRLLLVLVMVLPLAALAQDSALSGYSGGEMVGYSLMAVVLVLLYFLPSFVGKKHPQNTSITLVNLLLGWTIIGWIIAMAWATSKPTPKQVIVANAPSVADELQKLQALRNAGTLTETELQAEKTKLLSRKG